MDNRADVGHLLSVRTRVHPSWYLAVILITTILVTQYPGDYPLWERIVLGLLGSLLFLASMTIVTLLSNVAGILAHVSLRNATLFVFGGVAQVPEDSTRPGREIVTAVATLLLNLIVAGAFNWIYLSQSRTGSSPIVLLLQWLAFFWYTLAILHIVPAFPLAGGRILAAAVWKATGNYLRSLQLATGIGRGLGICLTVGGLVLLVLSRQTANGLVLMFFGWALQGAATLSGRRAILLGALQTIKTKNIMTREFPLIGPGESITAMIRDHVLTTGQDYFAVTDQNRLLGIVTVQDIKRVPKKRWGTTSASMIMTPGKTVRTVDSELPAAHVLEQMDQFRLERLPVFKNGEIIGIVARDNLVRLASTRAQLKI